MIDDKTMAQDAILVQDACNLSGVVHSFARVMHELCQRGLDTDERNRHPLSVMYSSKIASLTGCEVGDAFFRAHDWCQREGR